MSEDSTAGYLLWLRLDTIKGSHNVLRVWKKRR